MRRLNPRLLFVTVLSVLVLACTESVGPPAAEDPGPALQALVESVVSEDEAIHGAALAVVSPTLGIQWEGAAGLADPESAAAMTPANPVRIASNTKTYVAAAILRMVEDGRLDLDDAVAAHLPAEVDSLLEADGYDTNAITIRHLLTHTSGLFDHSETGSYGEEIVADPQRRWVPIDVITMAMELGEPHAEPGEVYTYCDTGYILLGLILERVSELDLAAAVRELVDYEKLGLSSTWWETLEPQPDGIADRAHQFFGEVDTHAFDPSFDLYGGGGIATTMAELARFHGGIFRGEVYHDDTTIDLMLTTFDGIDARADAGERALPPGAYRMGVWVLTTAGHTTYHHTGFWGTMAVHVPDLDLTVAATVNQNQSNPVFDRILEEVIRIVQENYEL